LCDLFVKTTKREPNISDASCTPVDTDKTSANLDNMNISVRCDRNLSSEISKIKFDGKSCVRSFIQKIEEFRLAKDISKDKLMTFAYEIFIGDALHWFRAIKGGIESWDHLIIRLREDFDVFDYDYRMITEIRDRTQGESENIVIFLSIMKGMFSRLSVPMNEADQLEILLHNIRPCYANVLANCPNISSIDQLQALCRNYEQVRARSENFKEPVASSSRTLAPEFAYSKGSTKNFTKTFFPNFKSQLQ
ncbi:hypothetical protein O3G_MSEX009138, partial [Manduca sexta]